MSREVNEPVTSTGFVRRSLCLAFSFFALLPPPFIRTLEAQAAAHCASAFLLPAQQTQQITNEATVLEPIVMLERQLAGVQKHSYQIELAQGQYATIEIDCQGISATISLFDAAGDVVSRNNADPDSPGKQTLDIVAEATGRCRLDIEGKSPEAPAKTYTIQLTALRSASEKELWRHQARRLSFKASALYGAGKYEEALGAADEALALREKALGPDHIGVGNALLMLANIHLGKGDYPAAEPLYLRALGINEKTSGPASVGAFRTVPDHLRDKTSGRVRP